VTLKSGLGVNQGHQSRHVSIFHRWFPINLKVIVSTHHETIFTFTFLHLPLASDSVYWLRWCTISMHIRMSMKSFALRDASHQRRTYKKREWTEVHGGWPDPRVVSGRVGSRRGEVRRSGGVEGLAAGGRSLRRNYSDSPIDWRVTTVTYCLALGSDDKLIQCRNIICCGNRKTTAWEKRPNKETVEADELLRRRMRAGTDYEVDYYSTK